MPMRLFTAIDLPTNIRQHLARISEQLHIQPALKDLSWTKPDNLHITLKFLGDIPDAHVPNLAHALARLPVPTMTLTLNPFLVLPGQGPARVLAAKVRGDVEPLTQLFSQIESAVQPLGVRREARPFKPHVTLARIKRPTRKMTAQTLGRIIDPSLLPTPTFTATQFTLYQSELDPRGSIYIPITRIGSA
jgi:2'-5' RNA ligase